MNWRLMRVADYGMLLVLALLCAAFSALTYQEQSSTDAEAAEVLAKQIVREQGANARVLVVASAEPTDAAFADLLQGKLTEAGVTIREIVKGEPRDARQALLRIVKSERTLDVIACTSTSADWLLFADLKSDFPSLSNARVLAPLGYSWPVFLTANNLRNIANQIAVIAILAVGMTLVIISGGIDLSVGSLIAFSAIVGARLIRDYAGAIDAEAPGMIGACLFAILACGALGSLSGVFVTYFRMPPFIVTLAMMFIARGYAYILADGQSVHQIPASIQWLGRESAVLTIPNAVVLMFVLYLIAHVMMTRTILGRYLYAVGGNREAARLAGVPVQRVIWFAYAVCGLLAGVGGILMTSQYKSAEPSYGFSYELYVIAAVVVGGTSLSGGEGRIFNTLIGAFIIGVIQNGMNLMNVGPYLQMVVMGKIILSAVLFDRFKRGQWGAV
jgi:ribose transport system permease protein